MTVSDGGRPYSNPVRILVRVAPPAAAVALFTALLVGGVGLPIVNTAALWTAGWTGLVLNALGVQATVDGTIIASESFAVNVVVECLALGPMLLFTVAVLASPGGARSKAQGISIGVGAIVGANLIRITTLFLLGSALPNLVDAVHILVWQSIMALLALAAWLIWTRGGINERRAGLLKTVLWATAVMLFLSIAWLGVAREYNQLVAGLASTLAGDGVSVISTGTVLLIDGEVGGGPVSVSGFTAQWGALLLASMIVVTSALPLRTRVTWVLAMATLSFGLYSVTIAALGLSLEMTSPLMNRLAPSAYVIFWAIGPIVLAGYWCLAHWIPGSMPSEHGLNSINIKRRARI